MADPSALDHHGRSGEVVKCFWSLPRPCPWAVVTRVSVRQGEIETWGRDCCAGHVGNAVRDALEKIMKEGTGSLHTTRYESEVKRRAAATAPYRPYLSIPQPLRERMVRAHQLTRPRTSMQQWIIGAIEDRVKGVLDHERNDGESSS